LLRAIVSMDAAATTRYFTGGSLGMEYYLEGDGLSTWCGKGSELLGLEGPVKHADFKALCENCHPESGEQLTPRLRGNRRVCVDFNLHVPKSVSVVYALTGDKELREAVWQAALSTVRAIEPWVETRVRQSGGNSNRPTQNLVCAAFLHETTRPIDGVPDPHLHVHCVVMNATFDKAEDRWKAIQLQRVWKNLPYFEAYFHSALVKRVEALGYPVRTAEPAWEIAGVSPLLTAKFCRRSDEIKARIEHDGVEDAKLKAEYGKYTRRPKSEALPMAAVVRDWESRLSLDERYDLTKLKEGPRETPSDAVIESSFRRAVERTFARSAAVRESALLTEALKECPGYLNVATIRSLYAEHGIISRERNGELYVTTKEALQREDRLLDLVQKGRGQCKRLSTADTLRLDALSESERVAAKAVLSSADLVTVIRSGGAGQTSELIAAVSQHARDAMVSRVIVLSATASAVEGSGKRFSDHRPMTVSRLLADPALRRELSPSILWVTEAHKLTTATASALVELAKSKGCRVVLEGNSFAAGAKYLGNALRVLERHADVLSADVVASRRHTGVLKEIVEHFQAGRHTAAVAKLEGSGAVKHVETEKLLDAAAKAFVEHTRSKDKAVVVLPGSADREAATTAVREGLRDAGRLGRSRAFTRLERLGLTESEKATAALYDKGMVIEFLRNVGQFRAGERWTVSGVTLMGQVEVRLGLRHSPLPVHRPEAFEVFERSTIDLAAGDVVRITKTQKTRAIVDIPLGVVSRAHAKGNRTLAAGTFHRIREFTVGGHAVLENGFIVKKSLGHLEYGYVVPAGSSLPPSIDHVVSVQARDDRGASAERLAEAVAAARRSVVVVTDRRSLSSLGQWTERPSTARDVTDEAHEPTVAERLQDAASGLGRWIRGVPALHPEHVKEMRNDESRRPSIAAP
jgi:conjugative relaxase-like TrwC/TraI family protein